MSVTHQTFSITRAGKGLRGALGLLNLFVWPFYTRALQPTLTDRGVPFETVRYLGGVTALICVIGWLISIRAGLIVQAVMVLLLFATFVFLH